MKRLSIIIFSLFSLANCEFPYLFGSQVSTGGAARKASKDKVATAASTTTLTSLDDSTSTKSQGSGTGISEATTEASGLWTIDLHGGSSSGIANNSEDGDAITQSSSKTFEPYLDYYNQWYKGYVQYLNHLESSLEENGGQVFFMPGKKDFNGDELIGQSGYDNHKSHASGFKPKVRSKSGNFTFNGTVISKGSTSSDVKSGWAKSQSGASSLGYNNYVLAKNNSGAKGVDVSTHSETSLLNKEGSVYSEADSNALATDGTVYSNVDASNHGFGAMSGQTDSKSDGSTVATASSVKGTPFLN